MTTPIRYRLDPPVRRTIEYFDEANRCEARRVTIYSVLCDDRIVALRAWCHLARSRRMFDMGRIRAVVDDAGRALPPAALMEDLADQIRRGDAVAESAISLPAPSRAAHMLSSRHH